LIIKANKGFVGASETVDTRFVGYDERL